MDRLPWSCLALAAVLVLFAPPASDVDIDWATVSDPGNAADTTGLGAVADVYRIAERSPTRSTPSS